MLNLSNTGVSSDVRRMHLSSLERVDLPSGQGMFRRFIYTFLIVSVVVLFLPWVQNFRAKGTVTALNPAYRPQTVHSTIPGRIENWYVFEGDTVRRGDTIAQLSEIKPEYLDPQIVDRTERQRDAKENSAAGYLEKAQALSRQIAALRREEIVKREQEENKLSEARIEVETTRADLAQQRIQARNTQNEYERVDSLYRMGLKSLTDVQEKESKAEETRAKLTATENKLSQARIKVEQAQLALIAVGPNYANKIAKAESDRQSALTSYYTSTGDVAKLESQATNYAVRQGFQYIVAPQSGTVARVLTPGIGETVKEGEAVVSILPTEFESAVEMYVDPFNLPLVQRGEEVRFLFDGWPAIFFSGWPGLSYGTFKGEIVAIDNIIDSKGRYRVLVAPKVDEEGREWPEALRPGSGAEGVILLNRVPVWYELWRQLNAFPPDYYDPDMEEEDKAKSKAPKKRVVK